MYRFWKKTSSKHPIKRMFLLTLVSSEASMEFLRREFNLNIVTCIKLDKRDRCFEKESDIFYQFPDLIELAKSFAQHYGRKIGITDPLGFNNGQYTFGFYYNTPDNTLPIFWGQRNGWIPVLKRYHKNYRGKNFLHNEKYI